MGDGVLFNMKKLENKQTDILFVVSPVNANQEHLPYYYLYLAGYLEKYGYSVAIADPHEKSEKKNINAILKIIKTKQPKFIGMASFVTDYQVVVELAKKIKKITNALILVGNAQPSIAPEDFLYENSPFDIVVRGEGELTVRQILEEYGKTDLENIKGIAYLHDGIVRCTAKRELMDLADCGMPAYHKIDMDWYRRVSKLIIRRLATVGVPIYTGRGCPFACTFCASNNVWNTNERPKRFLGWRKRPLAMVLEELRLLQIQYGFDFFYIFDDTFGIRKNDIVEFCEAYKNSGLSMLWAAQTRAHCIDDENIVLLLKESGCIQLEFGVESGSPKVLKEICKGTKIEDVKQAFELCRRHRMRTFANILLNLPHETEDDLAMTANLLKEIKPTYISVGATQAYPGTPLYESLGCKIPKEKYGKLARISPSEDFHFASHKLNLDKLVFSWQFKYGSLAFFEESLFRAEMNYWIKIFKSNNRFKYLGFIVKDVITTPFKSLTHMKYYYLRRFLGEKGYATLRNIKRKIMGK